MSNNLTLNIGWLYPDLMSTYGDRGNIIVLQRRSRLRNIHTTVLPIGNDSTEKELKNVDLIFGGGAQDREQSLVMKDLNGKKGEIIKTMIEEDVPALFVCGSPQLMGKYYEPGEGQRIEGVGIFDMVSIHPGQSVPRCIGNVVAKVLWENLTSINDKSSSISQFVVGFENHGGRTRLGPHAKPFAKVIKGYGNNGEDGTEGVIHKNAIGCYLHGPLLPKNPHIADWLIQKALAVKYKKSFDLNPLDDVLEWQAHQAIVKRLGVSI